MLTGKLELGLEVDPKNFHKMDGVIGKLAQANRAYRELRKASGDAQEAMSKLLPMGMGGKAYTALQGMVSGYIGGSVAGGVGTSSSGGVATPGNTGGTEGIRFTSGTAFQNAIGTGVSTTASILSAPVAIGGTYLSSKIGEGLGRGLGEGAGRLAGALTGGKLGARFGIWGSVIGSIVGATVGQSAIDKGFNTISNAWSASDMGQSGGFRNYSTASLIGRGGRKAVSDYYEKTLTFADLMWGGGAGGPGDRMGMRAFGVDIVKSNYEEGLEQLAQERTQRNKEIYGALKAKQVETALLKAFRE
jgi:hypothetical protein